MVDLSIGEAATAAGTTPDTIRYYDREGLLDALDRDAAGNRRFTADDVGWLRVLRCLRDTGMTIADLRAFCSVDATVRPRERLVVLQAHRQRVLDRIRQTQDEVAVIDGKIDAYCALVLAHEDHVPEVVR